MDREHEAAVIFDMDGVLIDSYLPHFRSWQTLGRETGRVMTEAQFAATFGRTSREVIRQLWPEQQFTDEQVAELDARKEEAFRKIIDDEFPVMAGAPELIASLVAGGFRLGIGSSAPPANVEMVIDRLGVRHLIGAVVTGADVERGKPDPQVFLLAAARLGLRPACCIVVEDAPDGVKAGHAAGMAVVALVSTGRSRELLSKAEYVVDTLQELTPQRFRDLIDHHGQRAASE
ncbi:MAG: HAD family phosphatase [Rhodopirellula sp.]|nr:HAD family phosphatase [Rhodopirellula sp.]